MCQVARKVQDSFSGIELDGKILSVILYADDICLISSKPEFAIEAYGILVKACEEIGMKVNVKKLQIVKRGDVGMTILKDLPLSFPI